MANERHKYILEILQNFPDYFEIINFNGNSYHELKRQNCTMYIDDYIESLHEYIVNVSNNTGESVVETSKTTSSDMIKESVMGKNETYLLWEPFFKHINKNVKFNMIQNYRTSMEVKSKLYEKRASKFGIEISADNMLKKDTKIHFVLDGLNMDYVVDKTGGRGIEDSITGSELRYAYRNRSRLEGKIIFYLNGNEVDAPWIIDSNKWERYEQRRQVSTSKV